MLAAATPKNRVTRTEGGTTRRFLVDDQTPTGYPQIAEELVPVEGVIRQYTYGTMRISQRQLLVSLNWQVSYYGYDGGGSVRQLTDPTGAITDTYAYDAFGNTVAQTGTTFNQFLYRGEQFDSTLGMYYLRARYYRPQVGRFLTADKYEGQEVGACDCANRSTRVPPVSTHHLFDYASNDPINLMDPSGRANLFETGELTEISLERTPAAKAIGVCVAALLRGLNAAFWHIGDLGPSYFATIRCALVI